MFSDHVFGPERKRIDSNVRARGGTDTEHELWVGKLLFLCRLRTPGGITEEEYGFIQYYECCTPQDSIDEALGCVCLR